MTNDFINVPRNSECVGATYGAKNEFAITVNNTEVLNVEIRGETYPIPSYAFGQAEIVDPENPTRLMVTFEEFGGCGAQANLCGSVNPDTVETFDTEGPGSKFWVIVSFEMSLLELMYKPSKDGATFNYRVMETDYENYTLVNSCVGTPKNHIEWVYFLTREREWPYENKTKVQELLYKITQWGLDIDSLRVSPQENCEQFMDLIP